MAADIEIEHDTNAGRFTATVDGAVGYLSYARAGEGTLDYRQTFVPESLRGRGIASALVRHALLYARDQGLKVIPSCPFVARAMERDPAFRDLRAG